MAAHHRAGQADQPPQDAERSMTVVQPEPALRWARDRRFVLPLLATAVPLTLQHLLSSTRNVANTFLTGQLGGPEVAAVGFCGLVFMVVTLAVSGMADGGSVITTQVWGSGNVARTRQAVALTLLASGLIAVAASTGCFMWAERIAAIGTSDPVVQSIAGSYIRVAAWMVIPYAVICSLEAGLRSVGKAAVTIRFTVIGVIAHVALAHGLIFGRWGLPEMGVAGAAWAAVLSSALEALLLIGYIYGTRNPIAFGAGDLRNGLREGLLRKIGRVGAPVAVSSTSWGSGILVYGILVGQAGTTELTVMAMMSSVETIAMAFSSGLAGSAAVIVGQGIGEGQSEGDVWKTGKALLAYAVVVGSVLGVAMMLTRPFLGLLFGGVDQVALDAAGGAVLALGVLFIFRVLAMMLQNGLLRSGGDTLYIFGADLVCQWLVAIPAIYLTTAVWHSPLPVIFLAIYSEEIVKTGISGYRVFRRRWIRRMV
ncbi:hypothetical protein Sipo7851_12685 [Streptomyces ipomoeae]|nr:hypothetical protein Sipo7851_12685 [Streptomyces ipomoeae]